MAPHVTMSTKFVAAKEKSMAAQALLEACGCTVYNPDCEPECLKFHENLKRSSSTAGFVLRLLENDSWKTGAADMQRREVSRDKYDSDKYDTRQV